MLADVLHVPLDLDIKGSLYVRAKVCHFGDLARLNEKFNMTPQPGDG